ncbi:carboxylating nicotinate-nucleotide diphosphorylase [bacterium]|nr:carboxylating nicotinate-nucleotide diphosphorylase [bacterium]
MTDFREPHRSQWDPVLAAALAEDLGVAGDLTTDAVVPADRQASGRFVSRAGGVVAGLAVACAVFEMLDPAVEVELVAADGDSVTAGETLAVVSGPARAILTGERTALNLLSRLCGIATVTRRVVDAADGRASITATRKTTPGLRALERYAVRCGGGSDHRFGLDDALMIKDNHLLVAGGIAEAMRKAKSASGHMVRIEVEVDSLTQLQEALDAGADVVLLDNMDDDTLRAAVALNAGRATLEASGGITPDRVASIAATGVDVISLGWLTHSAPALDIGLDFGNPSGC